MATCVNCHKNTAVIYTSRFVGSERHDEGYCLSCAYKLKLPGLNGMFNQAGVSEKNIEQITERINDMMGPMENSDPQELIDMLMGGMNPEDMSQWQEYYKQMMESGTPGMENLPFVFGESLSEDDEDSDDEAEYEDDGEDDEEVGEDDSLIEIEIYSNEGDGNSDDSDHEDQSEPSDSDAQDLTDEPDPDKQADKSKKKPKRPNPGDQTIGNALQMVFGGLLNPDQNGFVGASHGNGEDKDSDTERSLPSKDRNGRQDRQKRENRDARRKKKYLETYGQNLNDLAADGELDPLIGRETELERVIQILNRRQKNNPVLLGEPGVGKTAIAQGLAAKIQNGDVPVKLRDFEVYLLDMTAMVAGTQFRGQFETRMKGLVDECASLGNVILVIDELHNIMGAGDAEGAMNAANILKPALARGVIRILGSTTLDEYRRFIEKDSALERRFQKVLVNEPDTETTLKIIEGLADTYEEHHQVRYPEEVLKYTVHLSDRYVQERFFPDKAIDIIDEAGSRVNLANSYFVHKNLLEQELEDYERQQERIAKELEKRPDDLKLYERQANVKTMQLRTREQLDAMESSAEPVEVSKEDVASVVELWTGIPVQRITESESEQLLHLEERLHLRVIGQDQAVNALSRAIRRQRAGLGKRRKPASFIFVGPTGVGKTELVKALAEALFADENALIRLDMSEYMEAHTISKLIGSPPGYVGYDDGGQLTEKVRRKPYSVLLLDEIEKAHSDVFNILLQILDDGRLTDAHGRTVSFENTVIVMTSNAGSQLRSRGIGFGSDDYISMESRVNDVLRDTFRPEFLNRVDDTIVFTELTREEIRLIVDLMLKEVTASLAERDMKIVVSEAAKDLLAERGYHKEYGARPLRKTIQRLLEDPIADMILRGELDGKSGLSVQTIEEAGGDQDPAEDSKNFTDSGERRASEATARDTVFSFDTI